MTVEFRYTLRRLRGQMLGWGLGLTLLGMMMISIYDSFAGEMEQLEGLLELYPAEIGAFFGDLGAMFSSPEGFVSVEFFSYMPLVLGIFAVLTGSGLLVSDEESGTLDLIMAHPISRPALFLGRLLAFVAATLVILALAWVGLIVPMLWSSADIGAGSLWLPLLSLLAVVLVFGAVSLLLSMLLPSRRVAATAGGLLLVVSFFVTGLARLNENLERVARLSPINYYQTVEAFEGFNGAWFGGLLASAVVITALAYLSFLRRDIRVGGEGGWRLPWG